MHAANAETTTQVPDVQNNILWAQHLLIYKSYINTWGYKDSCFLWQGFSYGFKLLIYGSRLPRSSNNLPSLHVTCI